MGRPAELPFDADAVLLADDIFTAMGGPRDTIQLQVRLVSSCSAVITLFRSDA
eukprot:m.154251 g.154251  ORF g.154251 m.154251 type:complete len:53 (-) comp9789_c0_seq2:86-244(-)